MTRDPPSPAREHREKLGRLAQVAVTEALNGAFFSILDVGG